MHFDRYKMPPERSLLRVASNRLCSLFFHDFQHHSGTQLKAILEQQALCHGLILTNSVRISRGQFFLLIEHRSMLFQVLLVLSAPHANRRCPPLHPALSRGYSSCPRVHTKGRCFDRKCIFPLCCPPCLNLILR